MNFPEDVPTLTDGTVTLRAHREQDVPRIVAQSRDPETIRWTTVPAPYATADAVQFVSEIVRGGWVDGTSLGFAIEYDGRYAGTIDLRLRRGGEAEVGFVLHPEARGAGVMSRAVHLILDHGFENGVQVVHWRAVVGNWGSRRVAWRVGFRFGPTIPGLLPDRGERRDGWTAWIGRTDPREPACRWLESPVLETELVRLRPWRETDGDRLVQAGVDPELRSWMPESPIPGRWEDVPAYLERLRTAESEGVRVDCCIADPDSDRALGAVSFVALQGDSDSLSAEVEFWAHPDARGRGLITAGVREACAWALRRTDEGGLGARRLVLRTSARHTAARRLAERAGFLQVGTERARLPLAEGGVEDAALYDRLRD